MTVIMAASFRNGIAIAADTLLHDPVTMGYVMSSPKTMLVGGRVGIAQAGTFTGTQDVWRRLEGMDSATVTPRAVADLILLHASNIHAAKIARGESSSSVYLVAGYNAEGGQEIYSVEIEHGRIQSFPGEGQIAALGTLPNASDIATQAVHGCFIGMSNTFKVDEWVRRVVAAESAASPHAVSFPATLLLIRPQQIIEAQIEEEQPHDPLLRGFFA